MTSESFFCFVAGYLLATFSWWVVRRTMRFEHHFTMRIEHGRPDDPADYWKQDETNGLRG